jgi:hypothetical protein
MRSGDTCEPVGLRRPDAAHLQPDRVPGPLGQQRLDDLENDVGGGEHGDHDPGAADDVVGSSRRLTTSCLQLVKTLGIAVPGGDRDLSLQQPTGHG